MARCTLLALALLVAAVERCTCFSVTNSGPTASGSHKGACNSATIALEFQHAVRTTFLVDCNLADANNRKLPHPTCNCLSAPALVCLVCSQAAAGRRTRRC